MRSTIVISHDRWEAKGGKEESGGADKESRLPLSFVAEVGVDEMQPISSAV
jgi:hypothetical protein